MRKPISAAVTFLTATLVVGGAAAMADNFNPQPDPPGRNVPVNQSSIHQYEPPDPCSQAQYESHGSGAGVGKVRVTPAMRKAGGTQMEMRKAGGDLSATASGAAMHCLNPQPLPPG